MSEKWRLVWTQDSPTLNTGFVNQTLSQTFDSKEDMEEFIKDKKQSARITSHDFDVLKKEKLKGII